MISCGHRKDIFEVTGNSVRWLFTWNEIRYKALTHDRVLLRPEEHRAWISFQYLKSIKPHLCHYRCSSDHRADCSSYKQIHVVFYLLISHTNNCRARAAGNSGLTVITTTTSNGVYISWASRFWTLFCHGLMAVLLSSTRFEDMPTVSANNAWTVRHPHMQVELSLLPSVSGLYREERSTVKTPTNCIYHALLGFC